MSNVNPTYASLEVTSNDLLTVLNTIEYEGHVVEQLMSVPTVPDTTREYHMRVFYDLLSVDRVDLKDLVPNLDDHGVRCITIREYDWFDISQSEIWSKDLDKSTINDRLMHIVSLELEDVLYREDSDDCEIETHARIEVIDYELMRVVYLKKSKTVFSVENQS